MTVCIGASHLKCASRPPKLPWICPLDNGSDHGRSALVGDAVMLLGPLASGDPTPYVLRHGDRSVVALVRNLGAARVLLMEATFCHVFAITGQFSSYGKIAQN